MMRCFLPLLFLLPLFSAGCGGPKDPNQVQLRTDLKKGVKIGAISRYAKLIRNSGLMRRGTVTNLEIELVINHPKRDNWQFEYQFQFYDDTGLSLPCFPRGWQKQKAGSGTPISISGACSQPGVHSVLINFRNWRFVK
jgi:hypothetical protein